VCKYTKGGQTKVHYLKGTGPTGGTSRWVEGFQGIEPTTVTSLSRKKIYRLIWEVPAGRRLYASYTLGFGLQLRKKARNIPQSSQKCPHLLALTLNAERLIKTACSEPFKN
jgi:hypothetical protein